MTMLECINHPFLNVEKIDYITDTKEELKFIEAIKPKIERCEFEVYMNSKMTNEYVKNVALSKIDLKTVEDKVRYKKIVRVKKNSKELSLGKVNDINEELRTSDTPKIPEEERIELYDIIETTPEYNNNIICINTKNRVFHFLAVNLACSLSADSKVLLIDSNRYCDISVIAGDSGVEHEEIKFEDVLEITELNNNLTVITNTYDGSNRESSAIKDLAYCKLNGLVDYIILTTENVEEFSKESIVNIVPFEANISSLLETVEHLEATDNVIFQPIHLNKAIIPMCLEQIKDTFKIIYGKNKRCNEIISINRPSKNKELANILLGVN